MRQPLEHWTPMQKTALVLGFIALGLSPACTSGTTVSGISVNVDGCTSASRAANAWQCTGSRFTLRGEFARELGLAGATRVWWPTSWHKDHDAQSVWRVGDETLQLVFKQNEGENSVSLAAVTARYVAVSATSSPWGGVSFVDVSESLPGAHCALFDEPSLLAPDGSVRGPHLQYGSEWSFTGQWTFDSRSFEVHGEWSPGEDSPEADLSVNLVRGVPHDDGWALLGDTRALAVVVHKTVAMSPSAPADRILVDSLKGVVPGISASTHGATEAPIELWVGSPE